jgi:hypothetical protein
MNNNKQPPYTIIDNTIHIMFNNELHHATVSTKLLDAINDENWDLVYSIVTKKLDAQVVSNSLNALGIVDGKLAGREVPNIIQDKILQLYNNNIPLVPLMRFIDNLLNNSFKEKIEDVFNFIETHKEFPITSDGAILAWKKVQDDLYSYHSGNNGKLYYGIGETVSLPESEVDTNSSVTCSTGIHACSKSYLSNYYGDEGTVVILKIYPQDIRAVPYDYNHAKLRCVRAQVVDFADSKTIEDAFYKVGVYEYDDLEEDDYWNDIEENLDVDSDDWENDQLDDSDEPEKDLGQLSFDDKVLKTIHKYILNGDDCSFRRVAKNTRATYKKIKEAIESYNNNSSDVMFSHAPVVTGGTQIQMNRVR